jgi:hypothetical protein
MWKNPDKELPPKKDGLCVSEKVLLIIDGCDPTVGRYNYNRKEFISNHRGSARTIYWGDKVTLWMNIPEIIKL